MRQASAKSKLLFPHFRPAAYQRWLKSARKYFWKISKGVWAAIFGKHLDGFLSINCNINLPFYQMLTIKKRFDTTDRI